MSAQQQRLQELRFRGEEREAEVDQVIGDDAEAEDSELVPEKISTTSYIPGSNLAIASACCKYGNGAGFSRIAW